MAVICDFTPAVFQFTAFDGIIIAASTSSCGELGAHGLTFHDSALAALPMPPGRDTRWKTKAEKQNTRHARIRRFLF